MDLPWLMIRNRVLSNTFRSELLYFRRLNISRIRLLVAKLLFLNKTIDQELWMGEH